MEFKVVKVSNWFTYFIFSAACLVGTVISVVRARAVVWRGISLSYVTEHTALFEG